MADLSDRDVIVATIVDERAGVLGFARRYGEGVDQHVASGRLGRDEGAALKEAVNRFAGDVAIGLHRAGRDPAGVRAAMRAVVQGGAPGRTVLTVDVNHERLDSDVVDIGELLVTVVNCCGGFRVERADG